jgi:hypothetical protein
MARRKGFTGRGGEKEDDFPTNSQSPHLLLSLFKLRGISNPIVDRVEAVVERVDH